MTIEQQIESALSHHRAGRLTEAEGIYRQVLAIEPNYVDALHLLGALAGQMGQLDVALELIGRAIQLNPDLAIAHNNLGNILRDKGRAGEAIASFREAIRLKPDFAEAHNNLGISLDRAGQRDDAIASFRQAIRLQPDLSEAHSNLGNAMLGRGELNEAIALQREAIRLKPDYPAAHSDLVCALLSHPDYDARMIFEEHRRWNDRYAQPLKRFIQPPTNDRNRDRRLRIGYVSPDFRNQHVVGRCLLPLLREHDRGQVEVFCYANVVDERASADQFQRYADAWRNVKGLSDSQAVDLIRQDRIDILVDLALHSEGNRLTVFARKPAPVQVTYLGYCASTGLDTIDYRLSDPHIDPVGSDLSVYSERTFLLPETYWCYSTLEATPEPSPSPAASAGYITFGCLNSFGKASRAAQDLWAQILRIVPRSRLIIHSPPGIHLNAVRERFAGKGVSPDRLEFVGKQPWPQYVGTYSRIDIALDPFPWSGGVTTCDALWMGVPVVSLVGRTSVGRGGKSILTNIGMPELIAQTPEQYVHIAAALAGNLPRLVELRGILRQRMQASPLLDAPRFARNVEAAYRQMWRSWCAGGGNSTLPMPDRLTLQRQFESGMLHHRAGRLAEAEKIYRQVLAQKPDYADVLHRLGMLEDQLGRPDVGVDFIRRAIQLEPELAGAHTNLGNALISAGRFDEAIASHRIALRLDPDNAASQNNLGASLANIGQLEEAIALFQQAVRLKPDFAEAHGNLGDALTATGRLSDAIAAYRQAIGVKPDHADAHNNLGNALKNVGQPDAAIASFRQAIRLKPDYAEAHYNLGNVFKDNWRLDEAIATYRRAIGFKPDLAEAHSNLGGVLQDTGQPDDAVSSFRQAVRLKPDFTEVHSNLLLALNYQPDVDAGEILAEHRAWSDRHALPLIGEIIPHANDRSPEQRLRIGYVSADFWRHSVGQFFLPLLEHHDRRNFELFCYSNATRSDDMTERIKRACDVWRNIVGVADEAAAKLVRSDGIDILVDLSGHTNGNRLLLFARKPAPIQVTYLGYANTTGMAAIDYRLTDALADPPGMTDHLNVEKLWRMPVCAWCYQPPEDAPDIQPRSDGPITFGCFNAFGKINSKLTAIWAELLKGVPGSRLLLKSIGAGEASSRQRLIGQLAEHSIPIERIEMLGRIAELRRHLELYHRVDVALDTYPYHGTTTTCEALWMGVPVVSLAGRTHVSRVGVSLLNCVGLPELIAKTPEEYISIASELASNPSRLNALRGSLRNTLRSSPLMNGARFATEVEGAYRQMWRNWCAAGDS